NHHGAALQPALDLPCCVREIGHVVRAEQERVAMRLRELIARLVPQRLRLQAVRDASMRGRTYREPASRQQNRRRRADRALVREQHLVRTAAVAEMLVDVYNRPARRSLGEGGPA